jgi:Glycoside-hydrolase family GH114
MSVALKNDLGQVKALVSSFDFAIVEECFQHRECSRAVRFIEAGKAVLETEYKLPRSDFFAKAQSLGFSAMRKRLSLGPWRRACG